MKAIIQRTTCASVTIDGAVTAQIGQGFLVLLGVMQGDTEKQADLLAKKITDLRVFTDENDKMNLSLCDVAGELLVVSNFTLGADCSHGRRPSFLKSAPAGEALPLYSYFVEKLREKQAGNVVTGEFGADMKLSLVNDGPVTIILDTNELQ